MRIELRENTLYQTVSEAIRLSSHTVESLQGAIASSMYSTEYKYSQIVAGTDSIYTLINLHK